MPIHGNGGSHMDLGNPITFSARATEWIPADYRAENVDVTIPPANDARQLAVLAAMGIDLC